MLLAQAAVYCRINSAVAGCEQISKLVALFYLKSLD